MKNLNLIILLCVLIFGILVILMSCFNPHGFDFEMEELNITGDISFTDVTAAVLVFTNLSKTVDVTDVSITQPDWEEDSKNALPYETSFTNKPRSLEQKVVYLNPSEHNYQVEIQYDDFENSDNIKSEIQTKFIPLPLPKQVVELVIYRDLNGKIVIEILDHGTEASLADNNVLLNLTLNISHPDDTGTPKPDPLIGEGSSPAVIPPENRTRMATFVVVNRTKSQVIENVNFHMSNSGYRMGKVNVSDRQSIALGQGTWEGSVSYSLNNNLVIIGQKNFVVVPSNDPQAVREHYLYFYMNNHGDYVVTQEWPPVPNDVYEEDLLPPNSGFGRGGIEIINKTNALVTSVNIKSTMSGNSKFIGYDDFFPPIPIQNRAGFIGVIGDDFFPLNREFYYIQITLETANEVYTFEETVYLYDTIAKITINADDIDPDNILNSNNKTGVVIQIDNAAADTPDYENASIIQMAVRNAVTWESRLFGPSTWEPSVEIQKPGIAGNVTKVRQNVLSSVEMPILPSDRFVVELTVRFDQINPDSTITRRTAVITKRGSEISGGTNDVLHNGSSSPASNVRNVTISELDIKNALIEPSLPPVNPGTIEQIRTVTFRIRLTNTDGTLDRMILTRDPVFNEVMGRLPDPLGDMKHLTINQTGRTNEDFIIPEQISSSLIRGYPAFVNNPNFSMILADESLNKMYKNHVRDVVLTIGNGRNQLSLEDLQNGFMLYFQNNLNYVRGHSIPPRIVAPYKNENRKFWIHPPTHVKGVNITDETSMIIEIDHDEYRTETIIRSVTLL